MAGRIIGTALRRLGSMALVLGTLAACVPASMPTAMPISPPPALPAPQAPLAMPARLDTPQAAAQAFVAVADRIEPLAERYCRQTAPLGTSCDFQIGVDPDAKAPPNAFQTLDERQRPVIIFTASLIAMARTADELAFVMAHEVAHHIAGHIPRRMATAERGALLGAVYGQISGADAATITRRMSVFSNPKCSQVCAPAMFAASQNAVACPSRSRGRQR